MTVQLNVSNMHCQNCKKHVTEALSKLVGIRKVDVDLEKQLVTVEFDEESITPEKMIGALEDINYHAQVA